MPNVTVTRGRAPAPPPIPPSGHPKAYLEAEDGTRLVLPFAPRDGTRSGLADGWERIDRPGRRPLLLHTGKRLPSLGLELFLGRADNQRSIEQVLEKLDGLGANRTRLTLSNMSPSERGPWRITDLSITATERQHGTNHITRATASLSLTEASDALNRRGPLSGGKDSGKDSDVRRYTVKKGDTLRKLADRFYGSPGKWQQIAKANGIKKPGATLKPGRVLRIPPKK